MGTRGGRKLRFAQAGVSAIHADMYRDTLMLFPDDIELVGFYDPDPDGVRKNVKPDAQGVPFYPSIKELIARAEPDAVLVSTYPSDMPDWALEVARAGVHVWMEKPVAARAEQLRPLARVMAEKGLAFSTGYSWRFHAVSRLIKRLVDDGLLGKPYSIEFSFLASSVAKRNPANWSFDPAKTGGGILNWLGCHWFDLTRFITGAEATRVAAIEANVGGHPIAVEDAANVSLRLSNGMIGSLHCGFITPDEGRRWMGLRGSLGWAQWDGMEGRVVVKSDHPTWAGAPRRTFEFPMASYPGYGANGHALIRAFVGAIRGEGASGYAVEDAIRTLEIIEAAHESARRGEAIGLEGGTL